MAALDGATGKAYRDGSGNTYFPMFKDPVLVFGANGADMNRTAERARSRAIQFSLFTRDLFETFNDDDNRAAIARVVANDLDIVGMAFRCDRKTADKVLKGLKLLR